MAEYRLDIIASTEGLNQGLKNLQEGLGNISEEAIKAGKDTQAAFAQTGGVDKFQKSLKDQVLTLVKYEQEIKKLRTELKSTFDPKVTKELKAQLDSSTQSLIQFEKELGNTEKVSKSLKAQLRENKEILSQLEDQGLETTDTFTQLAIETGRLQDQVNDTNERIKFFASDTRGLDGLIGVTKLATAGFAVGQGAAALFGAENENVQKALLKVNAAMAILNGLQEIQAALQKSSAARITIETGLRKLKIFVLGEETVATGTLTTAQIVAANAAKVLRAALLATGIGAVLFLVSSLMSVISSMNDFKEETDDATKAIKDQEEALKDLQSTIDFNTKKNLADAKRLGASNELLRNIEADGMKAKLKALEDDIANKRSLLAKADKERIEAFTDGNNEEKKKALEQYQLANTALSESITNRTNALRDFTLFKIDSETEANKEVQENNKKFDDAEKDRQKKRVEAQAKAAKDKSDLLLKQAEAQRIADDFLNVNMKNQFDIEKEEKEKIIKNNSDFLNSLEEIKQLELDIEFESGSKSIAETRRIAEEKLKVELEFAEKRLELLRALGGDETQIKALELAVQKGKNALSDLSKEGDNTNFLKAIGLGDITEEDLGKLKEGLSAVANSIKSILGDVLDSAIDSNRNYIDDLTDQIETVRDNVSKQTELQNDGRANNLESERNNLNQLDAQRLAAFEKDKQLQKQKLTLDSVSQVSSLLTASASIFKALAGIAPPLGIALAVSAIAAMFGAFAVTQVKARQSINAQTLKKGGVINGKRHDADGWGGERFVSDSGNETFIEGGEYVVNRNSTKKYKALIDAINNDSLSNLQSMLSGTGVSLNDDKVEGYKRLKSDFINNEIKHKIELENKLGNKEIKEFKKLYEKEISKDKKIVRYENGFRIEETKNRISRTKL